MVEYIYLANEFINVVDCKITMYADCTVYGGMSIKEFESLTLFDLEYKFNHIEKYINQRNKQLNSK